MCPTYWSNIGSTSDDYTHRFFFLGCICIHTCLFHNADHPVRKLPCMDLPGGVGRLRAHEHLYQEAALWLVVARVAQPVISV